MKNVFTLIKKTIGWLLLAILLYIVGVLIYGTATDWQPEATIKLETAQEASEKVINDSILTFTTWNIGYGGLGAKSNFFFDNGDQMFSNGRMIRSPKEYVDEYVAGAEQFVSTTKSDFFLLQETDFDSKRSYHINEFDRLRNKLPNYSAAFAANYKNERVPLPIAEPWRVYGQILSGLTTLARFQPEESIRYQLPGKFEWPTRLFQLDRCVLKQTYVTANGKKLVVFNVHNSAYDKGGKLKKQQIEFLKGMFSEEYAKGNYVVVGGDWNQVPPNFAFDRFMPGNTGGYSQISIEADAMPADWTWVYDPTTPTNRKSRDIYTANKTFETLIDFFLISPNIKVNAVKGLPQGFRISDHQPVYMEIELEGL